MKGGYNDAYYFQMADNIRKFKGVRPLPKASKSRTITIDGKFDDWTDVTPHYRDTVGDTMHRNHPGWGSAGPYINTTGRNDFVTCKIARDDKNIYFHAMTDKPISNCKDENWMLLFIDADADHSTGWEGFDYLINHSVTDSKNTTVKRYTKSGKWTKEGSIQYQVNGNQLELAVPRGMIGITANDFTLDFHWADNIQKLNDITEFALNGDSAPNRRFKYRYKTAK